MDRRDRFWQRLRNAIHVRVKSVGDQKQLEFTSGVVEVPVAAAEAALYSGMELLLRLDEYNRTLHLNPLQSSVSLVNEIRD